MRALIIGGTGFIGSHVVRQLAKEGHTVAIFHRGRTPAALPRNVREILDPRSEMPIERFPREVFDFKPDAVVHTMAMGGPDATAFAKAFIDRVGRLVLLSSGDVYLAYGRLTGFEPGQIEEGLLSEDSPLRKKLFPYRKQARSPESLEYWYEKILAEQAMLADGGPFTTVLRLPKVFGSGSNEDLATVYRYSHQPQWRWTHGYVENIAAAIVLAATHSKAGGRTYNVGEGYTPTIAERLARIPPSTLAPDRDSKFNFAQNMAYDTSRIRNELGYREVLPEEEAIAMTLKTRSH